MAAPNFAGRAKHIAREIRKCQGELMDMQGALMRGEPIDLDRMFQLILLSLNASNVMAHYVFEQETGRKLDAAELASDEYPTPR